MANITRATSSGFDGHMLQKGVIITDVVAGEALLRWDALRIHSDGKAYKASTTFADDTQVLTGTSGSTVTITKSNYAGFAYNATPAGEPVEIVRLVAGTYAAGMTPGTNLYISASPTSGSLSDAPVNAGDSPVALVLNATEVLAL